MRPRDGVIGASLAFLDADLSSSLYIVFVINLLLQLPNVSSLLSLHQSHQPPASLYERLLSRAQ